MSIDTPSRADGAGVRAVRQAKTRRRLVDVAREMFLADGYAATSLDKVAERAGFSKGAVYSNFSGKEELCMAVLDSIHAEQIVRVSDVFNGPGDLDERIEGFVEWARQGIGQPAWVALESEFGAVARQSPFVASSLRRRQREVRDAIIALIEQVSSEQGIELRYSP
ncbi:MAG TPA: TetR/AcrR family transcriptional regulator, partial [Aeromicrobium sp.]|nr:TetR/AcrR family transcriptional regulator [Aeromicrobium sp.]